MNRLNHLARIMTLSALLAASGLTITSCSSATVAHGDSSATNANSRFETLYQAEWAWRQNKSTSDENTDDNYASSSLPDVSIAAQQQRLARWQSTLDTLDSIDVSALSEANQVNYAVYRLQIETLIADQQFKTYEKPLLGDTAFWSNLAYQARKTFRHEQDFDNYLAWLQDMPRYFDQQIANMRLGLARQFTLPEISLQGRDASVISVVNAKGKDNLYFQPFTKIPASISSAKHAELKARAQAVIAEYVIPAHQRLLTFLQEQYIPNAQPSIAGYDLPDGKAYYQAQIKKYTTLALTAEEIHQIGLAEVAKIRQRMHDVMKEVSFDGNLQDFLTFLRTDEQFYVDTPQALLDRAAWTAKEFDGVADDWFGHLPRKRFAIIPVPDDIAPFYTAGRGGPGVYLVNTYDLPSRPLYSLPALTLHESAPGHAFQMPLSLENNAIPEFRRQSYISAFGEGWALYSELLGEEMGLYHTPYEIFGMLSYQMWRAARLVVDTGIHAKGWSRQQAQDFMKANTALSVHEITTEVDRYIAWPGQALSYYLGQMAIVEHRAAAEKALGADFDIRHFHDMILQMGSVPLAVLEQRVERFIAEGGPSPYQE
ncbi:DUF885 domain-containing protein [Alteromonas gilva]|uniref:DUF885 family protein n=1 Tax=Alteromonas gilva TaxID=2987522 RepID=A0ABT5L4I9_9ALTE|nr:DUF885 family protein [Alteromonas gilva]MDC8831964.1 DUF885 family protein [Alteromonas gilva]